jgi:hypothetical protein
MTAKESKAVAWQYLYLHRNGAEWVTCDEHNYNLAVASPHEYETRILIPESALHAAEAELGELRSLIDDLLNEYIGAANYWGEGNYGEDDALIARAKALLASDGGADGDNEGVGK